MQIRYRVQPVVRQHTFCSILIIQTVRGIARADVCHVIS
jgi:hypothetical protein